MIDFLLGVPGKLKAISDWLTTYWTSARAAKLDYLTANVAVASTALSNATWTNGLAAILGNTIQTSIIQSIQTGYSAPSAGTTGGTYEDTRYVDVSVTAVTVEKCVVFLLPSITQVAAQIRITGRLTTTTNLRLASPDTGGLSGCRWYLVEFK